MHEQIEGFVDPASVRFTQNSISYTFRNRTHGTVDGLADALRTGRVRPQDIPPIRLVERDDKLYTLDNRRLEAFRRAGLDVPYRMATGQEIVREFGRKFDTTTDGRVIRVRGEPQ